MPAPHDHETPLILPVFRPFYRGFAEPLAWVVLRVLTGAMLVIEGWPKIQAPFAMTGFAESLGLWPAGFWSLALAVLQFGGGILLVLGLFTRPVALAAGLMLAVTLWYHLTRPYGTALLTPEGIAAFPEQAALFTADAGNSLVNLGRDGGARFLHQVQSKANFLSALWTVAALFFAAFGGGRLSLDRAIGREF